MTNERLTNFTRRKVLAGLGTVGLASAGAGLGTTAYFGDSEALRGVLRAGEVDLKLDYRTTYAPWLDLTDPAERERLLGPEMDPVYPVDGDETTYHVDSVPAVGAEGFEAVDGRAPSHQAWGDATKAIDPCTTDLGLLDGKRGVFVDLVDLKPYDEGETTVSLHLCGNPAYLYATATEVTTPENGRTEPEVEAGDATDAPVEGVDDAGELQDYLYVEAFHDADCDNRVDGDDPVFFRGSLAAFAAFLRSGPGDRVPLGPTGGECTSPERTCVEPGTHCFAVRWYLPCEAEDFEALPSCAPVPDADESGTVTLADELLAKGLALDANVAQTDGVSFGLGFEAEQCRHAGPDDSTETLAALDAGAVRRIPGIVVEQDGERYCLGVVRGDEPVEEFYGSFAHRAYTGFEKAGASVLFVYEDADGVRSLVMIHDDTRGDGGAVTFRFDGTDDLSWPVQDDDPSQDRYDGTRQVDWAWRARKTDGGVLGPLPRTFAVTVDPAFNEAAELEPLRGDGRVDAWYARDGDTDVPLALDRPVTVRAGYCAR